MKQPFDSDPNAVFQQDGILASKQQQQQIESASTSVTGGDSYSEEETGSWLGGIGADFRTLAVSLRETAGGVASFVKASAINVANEIAQLEDEDGVSRGCHKHIANSDRSGDGESILHLPWEVPNEEGEYQEDQELKTKIFALSTEERNFFEPYSATRKQSAYGDEGEDSDEDSSSDFVLDDNRVRIIRQLLKLDPPLSSMHARLSGRSDVRETTFWRNYFFACDETREYHLNCLELDEKLDVISQQSFASQPSIHSQRSLNSLVPDDDETSSQANKDDQTSKSEDESSFVCVSAGRPSPPGSVKSGKSTGSAVMVEAPSSTNSLFDYFTTTGN